VASREYIVAVRRDSREDAPADWLQRLRETEGVSIVGASGERAQISADEAAVERLRGSLGSFLHIEPTISHRPN
jgi:hypothetical protein